MVGAMANNGRIRSAFPVTNGSKDLTPNSATASTTGSEYGPVEFSREDVEALLNERIKYKSKFNYKERCENMMEYIKRLRLCIRWFQELELDYAFEQEKLKNALEMNEKHCADMETSLRNKEEELNMIIEELRKNFESAQIQLAKEQTEKLAANDSLGKEKEARLAVEKAQAGLTEELGKAQGELQTANQRMSDLTTFEKMNEFEEQKQTIIDLKSRVEEAELKFVEGEKLRKKLHNTILELKGNIRVFCRVRPLLPGENNGDEGKTISYPASLELLGRGIDLIQNAQKHSFTFDKVFVPNTSQEDVFIEISQLVQSALDGYKVCIFAYGQTGSGKTYTMMGKPGNVEEKGLIPRCLEQIFETRQSLRSQGWKYELQVSMLEIYNETIRDLLSTNKEAVRTDNGVSPQKHAIKHDAHGNTHVAELTILDVKSSREVSFLLDHAARNRSVGKTQMNEQSSRSHFVFTLRISGVNESTEQQVQGVLNLIDLAGSERLSKSGSTGDRLKETQAINKSLSSLGDVIFALGKKEDHVPFRNSKLTYLLQPCLGGDSKTLMFVNIAPESSSTGESLCSLRFAARVNACEIGTPRRQTNIKQLDRLSLG
ncbi:hypothetical protein DY000_02017092 [Brassica cretica]|uniref:Kinesin-like protein n=1 Tax=Brassica cretica TaxID=69181 RepID=A0ABQ7D8X7_BRACR|nr:hypothetical protein DY000_02017092 [Brassica cretica]